MVGARPFLAGEYEHWFCAVSSSHVACCLIMQQRKGWDADAVSLWNKVGTSPNWPRGGPKVEQLTRRARRGDLAIWPDQAAVDYLVARLEEL